MHWRDGMIDWRRRRTRRQALTAIGLALGTLAVDVPRAFGDEGWRIGMEALVDRHARRKPQPAQEVSYEPERRLKIAQMLLVGFDGTAVDGSSQIVRDIVERGLGGVVLFDRIVGTSNVRNIASPSQLTSLVASLKGAAANSTLGTPLLVAVDQEGGQVARLNPGNGFPGTYSAAVLGARNDPAFTEAQGSAIAQQLANVGINLNLAPVVDLNLNPANRIIGGAGRSFSGDAGITTAQAEAFIRGHRSVGVRTALKHFPGQGSASGDTHRGSVDVTSTWTDYELQPFANIVADGMADAVMTSHIYNRAVDATYPATLSAPTLAILRDQLGWDGVILSDDLNMRAISGVYRYADALALAINAGVDILTISQSAGGVVGRTIDLIAGMVESGVISAGRIDAAYRRVMRLKDGLA